MLIPLFLSAILAAWPQPSVDGVASWYGNPRAYGEPTIAWYTRKSEWGNPVKYYAAAGPELRKMIGDPNPYHEHYPLFVTNRKTGKTIRVVVVDWCQCSKGKRGEKLIDLSPAAFVAVCGPLGKGICSVTVSPISPPVAPPPDPVVRYPQEGRWPYAVWGVPRGPYHHRAHRLTRSPLRHGDRRG
jgi:hypothetical protein